MIYYRGIDLHNKVTSDTNENKKIFIKNANDTVTVKVPTYLKDISDYFRQLNCLKFNFRQLNCLNIKV